MKTGITKSICLFAAGAIVSAAVLQLRQPAPVQAAVASGNENFTMVTVPVSLTNESEVVFVLNHLTGILSGAALNNGSGTFSHFFLRNVSADFQLAAGTKAPQYAIVSAPARLRSSGSAQPAEGVVYIAELSTGAVIAYGYAMPSNRNAGSAQELVKLDFFRFGESIGQ